MFSELRYKKNSPIISAAASNMAHKFWDESELVFWKGLSASRGSDGLFAFSFQPLTSWAATELVSGRIPCFLNVSEGRLLFNVHLRSGEALVCAGQLE